MAKGALQFSFSWIFAIIVGAIILSLTIFGVTKLIDTSSSTSDIKTSKELGVLLNPLETGFESATTVSLSLASKSRIYNECNDLGNFGEQTIKISQKTFNKWSEPSFGIDFPNRYIFSDNVTEGQKFYLFSKPLELPFKVSDLIYMTSSDMNYCFESAPGYIQTEISNLNQGNLFASNCPSNSVRICFSGSPSGCDMQVSSTYVQKENDRIYYSGDALMYAAIFSDKPTYECQLQRLMKRTSSLLDIYNEKSLYLASKGCSTSIINGLSSFNTYVSSLSDSSDLTYMSDKVKDLENLNTGECRLW